VPTFPVDEATALDMYTSEAAALQAAELEVGAAGFANRFVKPS